MSNKIRYFKIKEPIMSLLNSHKNEILTDELLDELYDEIMKV
jgi:hypothetical protein